MGQRSEMSSGELLEFKTAFHHMDENGCYDGWTEHTVTVTPSLIHEFTVKVSGRDRNEIKSYIAETFQHALSVVLEPAQPISQTV